MELSSDDDNSSVDISSFNQTSTDNASTTGDDKMNNDAIMNGAIDYGMDNNADATNDFDNEIINEADIASHGHVSLINYNKF